jgi:hypothetical protein
MATEFHVPADFPRPRHLGAVPGAQEKILVTKFQGRFYSPGCTPPELYANWQHCVSLVEQFVPACIETKAGKRKAMSEVAILDQYLTRLIETRWCSEAESRWVIFETARLLGWPAPSAVHGS